MHNVDDGIKTFKCSTRYDWYVLEKKEKYNNTIIMDEESKLNVIDIDDWKFIPNKMFDTIQTKQHETRKRTTETGQNKSVIDVGYHQFMSLI